MTVLLACYHTVTNVTIVTEIGRRCDIIAFRLFRSDNRRRSRRKILPIAGAKYKTQLLDKIRKHEMNKLFLPHSAAWVGMKTRLEGQKV